VDIRHILYAERIRTRRRRPRFAGNRPRDELLLLLVRGGEKSVCWSEGGAGNKCRLNERKGISAVFRTSHEVGATGVGRRGQGRLDRAVRTKRRSAPFKDFKT